MYRCSRTGSVALLSLVFAIQLHAQQASFKWRHPMPTGNPMHKGAFVDDQHGFAVGSAGMVLETVNQGGEWQALRDPMIGAVDYFDLLILPDSTLLAAGTAPGLFHSNDGAQTWTFPNGDTGVFLRDLAVRPDGGISAAGETARSIFPVIQDKTGRTSVRADQRSTVICGQTI